eukprot:266189_1
MLLFKQFLSIFIGIAFLTPTTVGIAVMTWRDSDATLPYPRSSMITADDSVSGLAWILGGWTNTDGSISDIYSWNISSGVFVYHGELSVGAVFVDSQAWTVIERIVYFLRGTNIRSFDMETAQIVSNDLTLPSPANMGCVASYANAARTYIIIAGGRDSEAKTTRIYDFEANEWLINVPNMNSERYGLSCQVYHDYVYAIAGKDDTSGHHNTVEKLDLITLSGWSMLSDRLSQGRYLERSIVINDTIVVTGGYSDQGYEDSVDVIWMFDDSISQQTSLKHGVSRSGILRSPSNHVMVLGGRDDVDSTLLVIDTIQVLTSTESQYIAVDISKSWEDAQEYCQSEYGTDLATICDDYAAQQLVDLIIANGWSGNNVWIGLNDRENEGNFVWADGLCSYYDPSDLWNGGEPNNNAPGGEDCAIVILNDKTDIYQILNDYTCTHTLRFVCNSILTDDIIPELRYLTFDEITNEEGVDIGWVKILSCTEQFGYASFQRHVSDTFITTLAPYAISMKIVPNENCTNYTSYAVTTKTCSKPISALNNKYEMSFTSDPSDWTGSEIALKRIPNACLQPDSYRPRDITNAIYDAKCNIDGIHIAQDSGYCVWDWNILYGEEISVYFGYDVNKSHHCNFSAPLVDEVPDNTYFSHTTKIDLSQSGFDVFYNKYNITIAPTMTIAFDIILNDGYYCAATRCSIIQIGNDTSYISIGIMEDNIVVYIFNYEGASYSRTTGNASHVLYDGEYHAFTFEISRYSRRYLIDSYDFGNFGYVVMTPWKQNLETVEATIKNFYFKTYITTHWTELLTIGNTDVYVSENSQHYMRFSLPIAYYNEWIIIITESAINYRFMPEESVLLRAINDASTQQYQSVSISKPYVANQLPLIMYSQQFIQDDDKLFVLTDSQIYMFNLTELALQNTIVIPTEYYYNDFAFHSCITTDGVRLFIINQAIMIYDVIYDTWIKSDIDFDLIMSGCAASIYTNNDHIFIFGGLHVLIDGPNTIVDTVYRYHILNDSLHLLGVRLKYAAYALRAIATTNHKIYLYDGVTNQDAAHQLWSIFDVHSNTLVSYRHDTSEHFSTAAYDYNTHLILRYHRHASMSSIIELLVIDPISIDFSVTKPTMWRSQVELDYVLNDYTTEIQTMNNTNGTNSTLLYSYYNIKSQQTFYKFQLSYSNSASTEIIKVMMVASEVDECYVCNQWGEGCNDGCYVDIYDETMDSITINITSLNYDVQILYSNLWDIAFKKCNIQYTNTPKTVNVNESIFVHSEVDALCFENPLIGNTVLDGYIANIYNQRTMINYDIIITLGGNCSMCNINDYTECVACEHGIVPFIDNALEDVGLFTINISSKTTDLLIIPSFIEIAVGQIDYSANTGLTTQQIAVSVAVSTLFALLVTGVILYCRHKNRKLKARQEQYKQEIKNPLVTMIGIAEYINETEVKDRGIKEIVCTELDGIDVDYNNMRKLCESLNYDFYPRDIQLRWTEDAIMSLLRESAERAYNSLSTDDPYDSILVVLSGHGWKNNIITSDYQAVHKDAVHRLFGANYPELRPLPRIFVFDCCDGNQSRSCFPSTYNDDSDDERTSAKDQEQGKNVNPDDVLFRRAGSVWKSDESNPDYKLVTIHAANMGFEAKLNSINGSYLINHLVRKMLENIEKKQKLFFGEIMENIQQELHSAGKQQPVITFNNHTRYLQFVKGKEMETVDDIQDVEEGIAVDNRITDALK